jgi:hypothetical protein
MRQEPARDKNGEASPNDFADSRRSEIHAAARADDRFSANQVSTAWTLSQFHKQLAEDFTIWLSRRKAFSVYIRRFTP